MRKILLCLDSDPQPSVFDSVVAIDAGVDHLLRHAGVTAEQVRDLVYGAIFTRAPDALKNTALFIGGSDVAGGEALARAARDAFFGPLRVSLMLDPSGANTTAAAAVLAAARHLSLEGATAAVLAGTGPVGRRVARLLARAGASVHVASRRQDRAEQVCRELREIVPQAQLNGFAGGSPAELAPIVEQAEVIIAAGPPGVELLDAAQRQACQRLKVVVDLNAVPPAGIGGLDAQDKGAQRDGQIAYGAIGVGGLKMKIHRQAIQQLFLRNDLVLDAEEIFALGRQL